MTTEDVAILLDIPSEQVRVRLASLRRAGAIVSPARGLWVPVPPERVAWGAPEPGSYIDDMMTHLGCEYYVGWLSAASLHGASHQAVQEFQVATSKSVSDRQVGRSSLRFFARSCIKTIPAARVAVSASLMRVSTVGATMLDVAEDLNVSGGLDNAATVISELAWEGEGFLSDVLVAVPAHSFTAVRRLGWILENIAGVDGLDDLADAAAEGGESPSYLSPTSIKSGRLDHRWNIILNRKVDPDV
ncbi:type IV toxin-antitoxin system AbiEi family antitoxin [Adlercreutzia sp. ZJ138]|uniref:type IV toxin-antitoxin system AbiEi family antitoxin domain-containing protein n=1 Tax=Adlercreutzia sp. ZJ138 TaxID=2709405 RepID=UPI0013EDCB15|nr:type IV toxin-antitoxin system AbiEi family antitoxin [Adlercreutzia sp. ZJ138]